MAKTSIKGHLDSVEEFERVPVPKKHWKGWGSFIGMYAGEHTAGTEFVIGPLFVAHGVSAGGLVFGLLIGNLLAVLSWAFLCAPIATRTRITLYYMLEKICGSKLTVIYNVVNALMFCFLAGSMIAVAATAVGAPFKNLESIMPKLTDWLPTSVEWILIVLIVGALTTIVAMFGYNRVAKFASVAAPWMILVFIAAAIATLASPELGVKSISDFWGVAKEKIWTGVNLPGQSKFTFWHVMFFAWFCNMAMHIGMSDLSIFRYAKKWYYGFSSATGMYVGHYIAWLAAGILFSVVLVEKAQGLQVAEYLRKLAEELAANPSMANEIMANKLPSPAPGPLAYKAAGLAGVICVVIAGWTTANPTIYRAGLALQAIRPKWKTWRVTFVVGIITTLAACFPALVMKLLEFVALYGLILMPMGAIIIMDVYVIPKMGLKSNYAAIYAKSFNLSAAVAWAVTLIVSIMLNQLLGIEIFFLGLPGWFVAAFFYLVLSWFIQKSNVRVS